MKRKLKDGRIILAEMDKYNSISGSIETVTHYQLLPEQRRFLFRVLNQLEPKPNLSVNESRIKSRIETIIIDDEYTSDDSILLGLAGEWYKEYLKDPAVVMTSIGHEIRQLKVGRWYTNPKYEGIKYCKIYSVKVRKSADGKTFFNSIIFDEIINEHNVYSRQTETQSNPRYDDEMKLVPDEVISKIINK